MIYNYSWTPSPGDGQDLRRLMAEIEERRRHFERLGAAAQVATAEALLRKLRASLLLTPLADPPEVRRGLPGTHEGRQAARPNAA